MSSTRLLQVGQRVAGYTVATTPDHPGEYRRYEWAGAVEQTNEHPNPTIGHAAYIRMDKPINWYFGDQMRISICEREMHKVYEAQS